MMRGMVIDMNDEQLRTLADVQGFLDGTVAMDFTVVEGERYAFIARGRVLDRVAIRAMMPQLRMVVSPQSPRYAGSCGV